MAKMIMPELFMYTCRAGRANHAYVVGTHSTLNQTDLEQIFKRLAQLHNRETLNDNEQVFLTDLGIQCLIQSAQQYESSRVGFEYIVLVGSIEQQHLSAIGDSLRSVANELNQSVADDQIDWDSMEQNDLTFIWPQLDKWFQQIKMDSGSPIQETSTNWGTLKVNKSTLLKLSAVLVILLVGLFYLNIGTSDTEVNSKTKVEQSSTALIEKNKSKTTQENHSAEPKRKGESNRLQQGSAQQNGRQKESQATIHINQHQRPKICDDERQKQKRPILDLYCQHNSKNTNTVEWLVSQNNVPQTINKSLDQELRKLSRQSDRFANWFKKTSATLCSQRGIFAKEISDKGSKDKRVKVNKSIHRLNKFCKKQKKNQ